MCEFKLFIAIELEFRQKKFFNSCNYEGKISFEELLLFI